MQQTGLKTIAVNRQARHEYFVQESFETGIVLVGTEVKSIRQGGVNLKDSWCSIDKGELWIKGMHISPYEKGNIFNTDPLRVRKLLMHHKEIDRLLGTLKQEGLTLIPLSLYFKGSRVKVQLGLCKGKKLHDKRDAAAARDAKREIDRALAATRVARTARTPTRPPRPRPRSTAPPPPFSLRPSHSGPLPARSPSCPR